MYYENLGGILFQLFKHSDEDVGRSGYTRFGILNHPEPSSQVRLKKNDWIEVKG
jgi:hypothetical protein